MLGDGICDTHCTEFRRQQEQSIEGERIQTAVASVVVARCSVGLGDRTQELFVKLGVDETKTQTHQEAPSGEGGSSNVGLGFM